MQSGLFGLPRNGNKEELRVKRGPNIGYRLASRYGDTGLALPVLTLIPLDDNSAVALDISPKGPSPTEFGANGYAWIDVCDAEVMDSNYNNGTQIPVRCSRLAATSTGMQVGSVNFNGASVLPIEFLVGNAAIKARMGTAGFQYGSATRDPVSRIEATDDTIVSFLNVYSGEGVAGTSTNHPFSIWSNNTKRAIFDTSGNLTGLLSLQRTGGVAVQRTNTNDSAAAGYLGEYISSTVAVGSPVAMTTATTLNVTSISLTAGDWDVTAQAYMRLGTSTSFTNFMYGISSTSATMDFTAGKWINFNTPATVLGNVNSTFGSLSYRISLSATTTIYLVAQGTFTVSTADAWGFIGARRA